MTYKRLGDANGSIFRGTCVAKRIVSFVRNIFIGSLPSTVAQYVAGSFGFQSLLNQFLKHLRREVLNHQALHSFGRWEGNILNSVSYVLQWYKKRADNTFSFGIPSCKLYVNLATRFSSLASSYLF
ncbi:hypothetical protein ACU8KH_02458 [Lachancea thermotolerans]